jgi:hypothetical protein
MDIPKSDSSGAGIVTTLSTRCEFAESKGDTLRRFTLVKTL